MATIAKGQLTIQGGKLTSSRAYDPARAKISFKPQHYQWEKLRPPVCVDSFAELRAVLNARFQVMSALGIPGAISSFAT